MSTKLEGTDFPDPQVDPAVSTSSEAKTAAESKADRAEAKEAEAVLERYREGSWAGHPNYKCPYCAYATLNGSDDVELHILSRLEQGDSRHLPALDKKEAS
jgi:hypothetical protein